MKITAEFDSNEELINFIGAFGAKSFIAQGVTNKSEARAEVKKQDKPTNSLPTPEAEKIKETLIDETINADASAKVETEKAPEKEPETETKITKEMVREVFTKIIKAGKQKEAKTLTEKYGAARLPDIKESDYAAIYKEAEALI